MTLSALKVCVMIWTTVSHQASRPDSAVSIRDNSNRFGVGNSAVWPRSGVACASSGRKVKAAGEADVLDGPDWKKADGECAEAKGDLDGICIESWGLRSGDAKLLEGILGKGYEGVEATWP
ncbi:hypothetical protein IMZ48_49615, partial [Candidatus Bathyarchaeota archaeon]|nr:hypothetical protein [Candidatus Bathyarchaeota archaeon]